MPATFSDEISRFDSACAAAAQELDAIAARVGQQVGEEEAAIFRAHRLLLVALGPQHVDLLVELLGHVIQGIGQGGQFIAGRALDAMPQIAGRKAGRSAGQTRYCFAELT